MTIKTLLEEHECGNDQLWHNSEHKWITEDDERDVQFAIVFGDDGGDTFIKEFTSEKEFTVGLNNHIVKGETGCDFDTSIYVIIKSGEEYTPTIK